MSGLAPERQTTASQAPVIVHGSKAEVHQHWLVRTGQEPPPDLSDVFPVQWGKHNETFCLDWIERTTRFALTERQRFIKHPTLPGIGATIDAYRAFDDAVVEMKVLGPFQKPETQGLEIGFLDYYAPQVAVQIACRNATRGYLAVQQGNTPPVLHELEFDTKYIADVLALLSAFELCVATKQPPNDYRKKVPVLPEKWRTINLDNPDDLKRNQWGYAMRPTLQRWQDTRPIWAEHEQTKTDVKVLLPDDVGRVSCGNISIRRSKNGAVTIRQEAQIA